MNVELTQKEVIDAIIEAAAKKTSGYKKEFLHVARVATYGKAFPVEEENPLEKHGMVINRCVVRFMYAVPLEAPL